MSGSFESARWNAGMHGPDLGIHSHPKDFILLYFILFFYRMESEPTLTSREKSPVPETHRRVEPATLHHEPNTLATELFRPHWYSSGLLVRRPALQGQCEDWSTRCLYCDYIRSQRGSTWTCVQICPEIHFKMLLRR